METLLWLAVALSGAAFWNTIQIGKQNREIQDFLYEKLEEHTHDES